LPQYVRLNLLDRATGANLVGEADFVIRANAPAACGKADAAVACLNVVTSTQSSVPGAQGQPR
jgi:hypothetical protein